MQLSRAVWGAALGFAVCLTTPAFGVVTPEQKCQALKNLIAGKHAECLQRAEQKLALKGDTTAHAAAVARCNEIYTNKWQTIEFRTAAQGGTCPDSPLADIQVSSAIQGHSENIAQALAGDGFFDCQTALTSCEICNADATACMSNCPTSQLLRTGVIKCHDDSGTQIDCAASGQDGEVLAGRPRAYIDNGDGTITDVTTGLMWEKHSDDGSIHDKDNLYSWDDALGSRTVALNSGGGFAGYTDWRVPNVVELLSLFDFGAGSTFIDLHIDPAFNTNCQPGCTVNSCSCTEAIYWTSTSHPIHTSSARSVRFNFDLPVNFTDKDLNPWSVRAVRGGL